MTAATRVGPYARDILPIAIVAGAVVINQHTLKIGGAITPIKIEFVDKAASNNLSAPIGHPAGGIKFMHQGVNQRIGGVALAPRLVALRVKAGLWLSAIGACKTIL